MKVNRQSQRIATKLLRFCLDGGKLNSARARQVARRIVESRHRGRITILTAFQRLVRLDCAKRTAEIASAVALQNDLRERFAADLERLYGVDLQVQFVERPELIGGVRVSVGNDVYDDSIRYRLALLKRSISAGKGW